MKVIKVALAESDGGDGIGRHDDVPDSKFDADQFAKGIEVEKEHSDNLVFIESIVRDHLSEDPQYYTKLLKMEGEREGETAMVEILNPLYVKSPTPPQKVVTANARQVETSAFSNVNEGICPKCQCPMGTANLGQGMGNQNVYYCESCRVAEPIKNLI